MKKITMLLLALVMSFVLCACGNEEQPEDQTSVNDVVVEDQTPEEDAAEEEQGATAIEAKLGETISLEFVELTFEEMGIEEDIQQSITTDNSVGSMTRTFGPQPESGKKFIYLRGTIKNLAKEELPVYDFFAGEFDIDGYKYEVSANECDVYTENGETEVKVQPLTTLSFIMYASLPNELADSHTAINFRMGFYDMFANEELAKNRAFEDDPISLCPYQYYFVLK